MTAASVPDTPWMRTCAGGCNRRLRSGTARFYPLVCRKCRRRRAIFLCEYCNRPFRPGNRSLNAKYCCRKHAMLGIWRERREKRELLIARKQKARRELHSITRFYKELASLREIVEQKCEAPGCPLEMPAGVIAGATGWELVNGVLFCPSHAGPEGFRARCEAKNEARRRFHDDQVAKKMLSPAEYRAWDEFQSALADYHREHGRLAHKTLRTMNPGTWVQHYRQVGRIDVDLSTRNLETIDQQRKGEL